MQEPNEVWRGLVATHGHKVAGPGERTDAACSLGPPGPARGTPPAAAARWQPCGQSSGKLLADDRLIRAVLHQAL